MKITNRDLADIYQTLSTEDVSNYTKQMQHPRRFGLLRTYVDKVS